MMRAYREIYKSRHKLNAVKRPQARTNLTSSQLSKAESRKLDTAALTSKFTIRVTPGLALTRTMNCNI